MTNDDIKALNNDPDGLLTYEYLANNIGSLSTDDMNTLADIMERVDPNGQFLASAARYLFAIDPEANAEIVQRLVSAVITKDRERRYIGDLLQAIWGPDFEYHADELKYTDNNFRRIYKRLHEKGI